MRTLILRRMPFLVGCLTSPEIIADLREHHQDFIDGSTHGAELGLVAAGNYELKDGHHRVADGDIEPVIYGSMSVGYSF